MKCVVGQKGSCSPTYQRTFSVVLSSLSMKCQETNNSFLFDRNSFVGIGHNQWIEEYFSHSLWSDNERGAMVPALAPQLLPLKGISALFWQSEGHDGPLIPSRKIDWYVSDIFFVFPREPLWWTKALNAVALIFRLCSVTKVTLIRKW